MLVRDSGHISDEFFQFLTSELLRSLKKGLGDTRWFVPIVTVALSLVFSD